MNCDLCGAPLALLGVLGKLAHVRCVGCGMQFSQDLEDMPREEVSEEDS